MGSKPTMGRCNGSGLVHKYIGTSYDTVKLVADNMEEILKMSSELQYTSYYLGAHDEPVGYRQNGETVEVGDYYYDTGKECFVYATDVEIIDGAEGEDDTLMIEWDYFDIKEFGELLEQAKVDADAAALSAEEAKASAESILGETIISTENAAKTQAHLDAIIVLEQDIDESAAEATLAAESIAASTGEAAASAESARLSALQTSQDAVSTNTDAAQTQQDSLVASNSKDTAVLSATQASNSESNVKTMHDNVVVVGNQVSLDAISASDSAVLASEEAAKAKAEADKAKISADYLLNMTVETTTLESGQDATAYYDTSTGVLSLGVPQGEKGNQGESSIVEVVNALDDPYTDKALSSMQGTVLDGKISTVSDNLGLTNAALSDVSNKADSNESDVSDLKTGLSNVEGDVDNIEIDLSSVIEKEDILRGDHNELEDRVHVLETTPSNSLPPVTVIYSAEDLTKDGYLDVTEGFGGDKANYPILAEHFGKDREQAKFSYYMDEYNDSDVRQGVIEIAKDLYATIGDNGVVISKDFTFKSTPDGYVGLGGIKYLVGVNDGYMYLFAGPTDLYKITFNVNSGEVISVSDPIVLPSSGSNTYKYTSLMNEYIAIYTTNVPVVYPLLSNGDIDLLNPIAVPTDLYGGVLSAYPTWLKSGFCLSRYLELWDIKTGRRDINASDSYATQTTSVYDNESGREFISFKGSSSKYFLFELNKSLGSIYSLNEHTSSATYGVMYKYLGNDGFAYGSSSAKVNIDSLSEASQTNYYILKLNKQNNSENEYFRTVDVTGYDLSYDYGVYEGLSYMYQKNVFGKQFSSDKVVVQKKGITSGGKNSALVRVGFKGDYDLWIDAIPSPNSNFRTYVKGE